MNRYRVVLDLWSDLVEADPGITELGPVERDLDAIFGQIPAMRRERIWNEMARIEVLARVAYGAYRFLSCLASAEPAEQSQAAANLREIARCLVRHYPMESNLGVTGSSSVVLTPGVTPSPKPNGGGDT